MDNSMSIILTMIVPRRESQQQHLLPRRTLPPLSRGVSRMPMVMCGVMDDVCVMFYTRGIYPV